jgi:hypothetical protein
MFSLQGDATYAPQAAPAANFQPMTFSVGSPTPTTAIPPTNPSVPVMTMPMNAVPVQGMNQFQGMTFVQPTPEQMLQMQQLLLAQQMQTMSQPPMTSSQASQPTSNPVPVTYTMPALASVQPVPMQVPQASPTLPTFTTSSQSQQSSPPTSHVGYAGGVGMGKTSQPYNVSASSLISGSQNLGPLLSKYGS